MKITKTQLRKIIKEQIQHPSQTQNLLNRARDHLETALSLLEDAGQDEAADHVLAAIDSIFYSAE